MINKKEKTRDQVIKEIVGRLLYNVKEIAEKLRSKIEEYFEVEEIDVE